MRRQLASAALIATVLLAPLWAQIRAAPRGSAPMERARGPVGVPGGSAFVGTPRIGVRFGTGLHQPFIRSRQSFVGFRRPFFGPRRFHQRVFFPTFSPFYFGHYGYPGYYADYSYSTYPAYNYSSADVAQNDIARQQQDIERLEDEVARLREEREARAAV